MKPLIFQYLLFILLSPFLLLANESGEKKNLDKVTTSKEACRLDIGWTEWKPYQYLSEDGKVAGLQINLLELISKQMNCEFVYHNNSWLNSVKAIENGQLDLIGNATISPERQRFAYFSESYRQDLVVLYIRSKEKERYGLSSLKELMISHGVILGMVKNAVYDQQVSALQNNAKIRKQFVFVERSKELLPLLIAGKIDGYFEDPLIFDYSLKGSLFNAEVESYPLVIKMGSIHFMFSKKRANQDTIKAFNRALKNVKSKYSHEFDWFTQL